MNNKLVIGARVLLGLVFVVFGSNFFFHFLPEPPMPERAGAFAGALFATGYMFVVVKAVEVGAGLLLLLDRFVPLALAVLAPIVVNIVLFHGFLARAGMALPLLVLALTLFLAWSYRAVYRPMLAARVAPTVREDAVLTPAE
jgi:uncharacterized membrane protein YphA (DoxX/SURF4 family)